MESMQRLGNKYNDRTKEAASRVKNHLEQNFSLHFGRDYRNQGSVMTDTNIRVHSDFDLLTIVNRYHYPGTGVPNDNPYTESDPNIDIKDLRKQAINILESQYDIVDTSGEKSIFIFNKALNRKVDVVFCFWYNSKDYEDTKNEYYRGVYLYNFKTGLKKLDFPFAHISQVNSKGDATNDGSRKAIRLLKTLRSDNDDIKLNSFVLTTVVHAIDNSKLFYQAGKEISIAKVLSIHLEKLIRDGDYRRSVKSPNGTEQPLTDEFISGLKLLKYDLDQLIQDVEKEIYYSYFEKGQLIYS
ncbi:hypothetical protein P0R33_06415 [Flavobacterium sp. YJ01]|uniref:hypothetical protein n=1 Tax=Flavobacterium sp. YJ01 TaxID=3031997 RepID=UPI0023E3DA36|nr:hypothetical protein [Flavobacterium sp. YJ01]WET03967.1 hypothetical protein P0R33_06415 [Flavobacterium sp. YJ01]